MEKLYQSQLLLKQAKDAIDPKLLSPALSTKERLNSVEAMTRD
jgi:hypothetical protein